MKIEVHALKKQSIEQFAEDHDLIMVVNERDVEGRDKHMRYYASFNRAEIKEGGLLIGSYGSGSTIHEAMASYAIVISGRTLIINAGSESRREIAVPMLLL